MTAITSPPGPPGLLVIVTMECPWPAVHGARVDIWNRWRMLRALGWRLVLVTWEDSHQVRDAGVSARLGEVFEQVHWLPKSRGAMAMLWRLAGLLHHSPHVWSRSISAVGMAGVVEALEGQQPDAVILDSLYGALAARRLARQFGVPLLYRAHNIEHLYMPHQARVAKGFKRRLALVLASLHLRRLETEIHGEALWTFDISQEDLDFWKSRGYGCSSWLPPFVPSGNAESVVRLPWGERPYDIVYLGNLNTPNNVAGLAWFFEQVMQQLLKYKPEVSVLIAGSNPSPHIRALVAGQERAVLLPNPADANHVRAQGRVLINPVLVGSGVNVKSVEMLFTDSPVVTTGVGVQGLAADVKAAFLVADDADRFAEFVAGALAGGPVADDVRQRARAFFGTEAAQTLSMQLHELLAAERNRR